MGIDQHREPVRLPEVSRRLGQTPEQRKLESLLDLRDRANASVEGVDQEGQAEADDQAEHRAEDAVAKWSRLDMMRGPGGADEQCIRLLEHLQRPQFLDALDEARVERGVAGAACPQRTDPLLDLVPRP